MRNNNLYYTVPSWLYNLWDVLGCLGTRILILNVMKISQQSKNGSVSF
jgi:hypothetical protein